MALEVIGAIRGAVESVPGVPSRPQEFARLVGVNKDVASRLFAALRSNDALAAVHKLPGGGALRQVMGAVRACGADEQRVLGAEEALRTFDRHVRERFDDRAGLEAALGAWLPGARRKSEATSKQMMYRGAVGLKGVTSDAMLVTFMAFPSATDAARCDTVVVNGFVGLRRVRPGAVIQFSSVQHDAKEPRLQTQLEAAPGGPLLREFCHPMDPPLRLRQEGWWIHYELADTGVGPKTAVDLFSAESYPRNHPRVRDASKPGRRWFYAAINHPTKVLVLDVLLHESMWPGVDPDLRVYDTIVYGCADANDPHRDKDLLDLAESIVPMGLGVDRFRCEEVPRYRELLSHMFERTGQDGSRFRGYRCRIAYPFYGSQACMVFTPPEA